MTKTISLRMDEKVINYLKKMSHYVSIERNEDLTYNDLITEAVLAKWPLPLETDGTETQNDG
jgi:hypothetical protein